MTKINQVVNLSLDEVKPNPYQPRKMFDRNALDELAASIKEHGVLQPISVRLINGTSYELVAGERRLRACKLAEITSIPAIIVEINDLDSAVLAIIENMQRQDLHFFEEAEGFMNLISDHGFTQEVLAARIGKSQASVANRLRVFRLPKSVQKLITENGLTERHARALLKLEGEESQLEILEKVIKYGLNVRKTENLIEQKLKESEEDSQSEKPRAYKTYIRDIRILANSIKENLDMVRHSGIDSKFDMEKTETGCNIVITLNYGAEFNDESNLVPISLAQ